MNTAILTVPGTVTADGSLKLDAKLNLPPGRVTVTVQPAVEAVPSKDPFMEGLTQIRAKLQASGYVPRSAEASEAEIRAMRDEAEEEMQEIERLHEECQRAKRQQGEAR